MKCFNRCALMALFAMIAVVGSVMPEHVSAADLSKSQTATVTFSVPGMT